MDHRSIMKCGFVCVHVCVLGIDKEASVKRTRMTEGKKGQERKEEYKAKGEGAPPLQQVPTSLRTKGH